MTVFLIVEVAATGRACVGKEVRLFLASANLDRFTEVRSSLGAEPGDEIPLDRLVPVIGAVGETRESLGNG